MPYYMKFMKEVMFKKKKLEAYSTISLLENCSLLIQKKLPKKLKNSGSFTIPYKIGKYSFNKALCDQGVVGSDYKK